MEVAVVGGGAVGLVTAADLAARGCDVVCFERGAFGSGATGRAAGLCYDAFADPTDAAVATRALERYRDWDLLEPCPYVWLGRTAADVAAIERQVDQMQRLGLNVNVAAPHELAERWPALETTGTLGAGIAEDAGLVEPQAVVEHLLERASGSGVDCRPETPVSLAGPRRVQGGDEGRDFDAVVVAAGHATADIVGAVGIDLALKTYRAQVLRTERVPAGLPAGYDATREFYWRPAGEGALVGDGAHEVEARDWGRAADQAFVDQTVARFTEATTADEVAVRESWAGLCTATPDRDPLVGSVADGLWVATGWQGHGLMRAPAMGEFLAAAITEQEHGIDASLVADVDPTRFSGDEDFDALGDPTRDW